MVGSQLDAKVQLDTLASYTGYSVRWEDADDNTLLEAAVDTQGQAEYSGTELTQQRGHKPIHARLITPNGICDTTENQLVYVCASQIVEDFTTSPANWTLHGDAAWDSGGWLEMTGIASGQKGQVYNSLESISDGVVSIRFTLKTGGGLNNGADGFAFTIIDVSNPNDLVPLLNDANSGGGLAYGLGGSHGNWVGDAVTVEIDTYRNQISQGHPHDEPTSQNHIAITENADPGNHLAFYEVPGVEDLQPHSIRVDIFAGTLRVWYDGVEVINQAVTIGFKGGHMFFSGSTGWATNYHIFDNLDIYHQCQ